MTTEAINVLQTLTAALNPGSLTQGGAATSTEPNAFGNTFVQQLGQLQADLKPIVDLNPQSLAASAANKLLPPDAQTALQNVAALFGNRLPLASKADPSIDLDETLGTLSNVLQRLQSLQATANESAVNQPSLVTADLEEADLHEVANPALSINDQPEAGPLAASTGKGDVVKTLLGASIAASEPTANAENSVDEDATNPALPLSVDASWQEHDANALPRLAPNAAPTDDPLRMPLNTRLAEALVAQGGEELRPITNSALAKPYFSKAVMSSMSTREPNTDMQQAIGAPLSNAEPTDDSALMPLNTGSSEVQVQGSEEQRPISESALAKSDFSEAVTSPKLESTAHVKQLMNSQPPIAPLQVNLEKTGAPVLERVKAEPETRNNQTYESASIVRDLEAGALAAAAIQSPGIMAHQKPLLRQDSLPEPTAADDVHGNESARSMMSVADLMLDTDDVDNTLIESRPVREKASLKPSDASDADGLMSVAPMPVSVAVDWMSVEPRTLAIEQETNGSDALLSAMSISQEGRESRRAIKESSLEEDAVMLSQGESETSTQMNRSFEQSFNALFGRESFATNKATQEASISAINDKNTSMLLAESLPQATEGSVDRSAFSVAGDLQKLNQSMPSQPSGPMTSMSKTMADPAWSSELGDKLIWMHKQAVPSVELRLNPEHLGPIVIKIDVQNDQASVSFSAQHQAVKEAIEASIPKLRDMLGGQQLQLADVNVSQHQSEQRQAREFYQAAGDQGQNRQPQTDEALQQTVANDSHDIMEEIEAGRAIASNGLLSLFA